ncbi:type II toxin-antitoxin system PemK/MazF family toxin [Arthrobacter sp. Sr24]
MASTSEHIFKFLRSLAGALLSPRKTSPKSRTGHKTSTPKPSGSSSARPAGRPAARPTSGSPTTGLSAPYPGDFRGTASVAYSPKPDGAADPGEIVWTWVPYEEDHSQGKDRPVLIVGKSGKYLLALMMTSKDHDNNRRGDNDYIDIGSGSWDKQGRDSEVKLNRILQVSARDLRREGAVLEKKRFSAVATGLRQRHGWK